MKTILVLNDYTETARNATNYACNLAQVLDASIVLYHSFFFPAPNPEISINIPSAEELIERNTDTLKRMGNEITDVYGIKVTYYTNFLPVSSELKSLIQRFHADLVIIGRKKVTDWEYKIVGSTAATVFRTCTCPVLIIPEGVQFKMPSHLLFACDYTSVKHEKKLEFLSRLATAFQAQVYVLHIDKPEDTDAKNASKKQLPIYLEAVLTGIQHEYVYREDKNIVAGIDAAVQAYKPDLLVVVSKIHGFWDLVMKKSITRKILFHTQIPLLGIPD